MRMKVPTLALSSSRLGRQPFKLESVGSNPRRAMEEKHGKR